MQFQLSIKSDKCMVLNTNQDPISAGFISNKSIEELNEVKGLKLLKAGKINHGTILWGTVVEPTYKIVGLQCLIEDKMKQLSLLTIYNLVPNDASFDLCQRLVPVNSRIGIKEPYVKCFQTGKLGIRVDNPKNIKIIKPNSAKNEEGTSAYELKEKGNELFKMNNYDEAVQMYISALNHSDSHDSALKVTILSNCAACRLKLLKFDEALSDATKAIQLDSNHDKSIYRKGEALFGLRRFVDSKKTFLSLLKAATGNFQKELNEKLFFVSTSIRQSVYGEYRIQKAPDDKYILEDKFNENYFSSSLEIRNSPGKGRGIFLNKDVKKNELLIVETALISSEIVQNEQTIRTPSLDFTNRKATTHDRLLHQVLEKTGQSKAAYARFSILYDGTQSCTYIPNLDFYRYDDHPDFNCLGEDDLTVKKILDILDYNCFGNSEIMNNITELYLFISLINHNDNPNCISSCANVLNSTTSVTFLASGRDMKKGTELSIKYASDAKTLLKWGIK